MKLKYVTNARIPTEKAHGIQIMKMCEAFANQGLEVELVLPRRFNKIKEDPFSFFNIEKNFSITYLPCVDLLPLDFVFGKVAYWIQYATFSLSAFFYTLFKRVDIFYGRHELTLLLLSLYNSNIIWEVHKASDTLFAKLLIRRIDGIIAITKSIKDFYISKECPDKKIIVAHDAVDIEQFDIDISKEDARKQIDLPQNKKIAMYVGHLYKKKGVNTLAEAAKLLPDNHLVVFVGGTDQDIKRFRRTCGDTDTIRIIGCVLHEAVPVWLKAADVLVLPNSSRDVSSATNTSPMKLFEYMASGRPITASDVPALREVLSDQEAEFFESDDSEDLAKSITRLTSSENSVNMASRAREKVNIFSWQRRAENIISFIKL